jgi:hypothetical protein
MQCHVLVRLRTYAGILNIETPHDLKTHRNSLMNVIVPLAGPDFIQADGYIKGLLSLDGKPLIRGALDSRPWACSVRHYSFVLYDCQHARDFADNYLTQWYKNCSVVFVSRYTRGAALSALSGVCTLANFSQPLVIDLADIIFTSNSNIKELFQKVPSVDGIALFFKSSKSQYSYLVSDVSGFLSAAAEKKVISDQASSGTYIFRNSSVFLMAVVHALENESTQAYNNLFYVCPLFNGIIAQGRKVLLEPVFNVLDIKT